MLYLHFIFLFIQITKANNNVCRLFNKNFKKVKKQIIRYDLCFNNNNKINHITTDTFLLVFSNFQSNTFTLCKIIC